MPISSPRPAAPDPSDLAERWRRARSAVLERCANGGTEPTEPEWVLAVAPERREELRREVGRDSWRLGRSLARSTGPVDDLERLGELLDASGIPCARGERTTGGELSISARNGCPHAAAGSAVCDFYRDAIDGFVCGASERLRFSRWRSAARSAGGCEDVLYSVERRDARFEPLPPDVHDHLAGPIERLGAKGVGIELLGMTENRVYVRSESSRANACGPGKLYFDLLAAHLATRFPELELVDASPRAVMA